MKNLKDFIYESKQHVDTATVADFYQWACLGELPDGTCNKSQIDPDCCQDLIDNGWFTVFGEDDGDSAQAAAEFFEKNWDKTIKVTSKQTQQDWEVSFTLNGTKFMAAFLTYFGDEYEK